MLTIYGNVVIRPPVVKNEQAEVRITLLDTTIIDVHAVPIGGWLYSTELFHLNKEGLEFALQVSNVNPRKRYELSVSVDVLTEDGKSINAYINKKAYPVLTFNHPNHLEVEVNEIRRTTG